MARPRSSGTLQPASEEPLSDAGAEEQAGGRAQPGAVEDSPLALPSEPSVPTGALADNTIVIYGPPKIGKSTLASGFDGALFFDTEGGLRHLQVYKVPVPDWPTFLKACRAFVESEFQTAVIDTADKLAQYCRLYVNRKLGILHESDLEYGKGWDITQTEFARAIAALAASGKGLILISHSSTVEIKTRNRTYNKEVPTLSPKGMRNTVLSLADIIIYIGMGESEGEGDDVRGLFTKESLYVEAGERGENPRLPEFIPWPIGESGYDVLAKAWSGADS